MPASATRAAYPDDHTLVLERHFAAAPEVVFRAFTDPAALSVWWGPQGLTPNVLALDLREGGGYRIDKVASDGTVYKLAGEYVEIAPPRRLSFTWRWLDEPDLGETLVTIELTARLGGTDLRLTHTRFPNASIRDQHDRGWGSTIDKLAHYLAKEIEPMSAKPILYGIDRSTYTRTARMCLIEKGVDHAFEGADFRSDAYRNEHHPFGKVPALVHGDFKLYETLAISQYVDAVFDGPSLTPSDPRERARMFQWISAFVDYLYPDLVRNYVLQFVIPRGPDGGPDTAVIESSLPLIRRDLAVLEAQLGRTEWLAGNQLSIADLYVAPCLAYIPMFPHGKELMAAAPKVQKHASRLAERDSFKKTEPAR